MDPRLLHIVGAGGYARCIADVAICTGLYTSVIFYDRAPISDHTVMTFPVRDETELSSIGADADLAIGIGDNALRNKIAERLMREREGCCFPALIHPKAIVSKFSTTGPGTVILAGAIVGPNVRIGAHVSLYSGCIVEHDSELADYVTLAPGAMTGGTVKIGERSFIGLGATINHGLSLGADTIVAAGAAIVRSADGNTVLGGVPARAFRRHEAGDKYL